VNEMKDKKLSIETELVHGCSSFEKNTGAISFPIYQSATFRHPGINESTGYDYSRVQNPTREELEKTIALLEEGERAFAFSSGMSAISTLFSIFEPNIHVIVSDDLYGGTYRLFEEVYVKYGIEFTYTDTSDLENVKALIKENTKVIFIETPSNPMMKITDIQALVNIAKPLGIKTIVDNTFLTPYFQKPLSLGADIVVHSGTKYIGGHNDTLSGFIILNDLELAEKVGLYQCTIGGVLSPFDSWLVLRGIKTLGIRLERQQENAIKLANWLKENKKVEKVYYAGLPEHDGYEICKKQASGFGAMISFTVMDAELVERILNNVKVIGFAESLGGVESLITYPIIQTHASIPEEMRNRLGVNDKLLRVSVGIEAIEDIINDLEMAIGD